MNNFELDEKAKQYEDTMTPYALARRIIELEESQNKIKADAVRECSEESFVDDEVIYMMMQNRANKLERGEL